MNRSDKLFLEALKASLVDEKVNWDFHISTEDWCDIFHKAEIHQVLPLIYNAVYRCQAAAKLDRDMLKIYKKKAVHRVITQTMRTEEFLKVYQHLMDEKVHPVMVKGIVCRQLYPNPDYRASGDEDMLVRSREFNEMKTAVKSYGLTADKHKGDYETSYEITYRSSTSPMVIEMHRSLFPPDSEEYGEMNQFFKGIHSKTIKIDVNGVEIRTLDYTDHLFYLICHAFKHLLHGGVGIRQICDMVMFANAYGDRIDWVRILDTCREIKVDLFAAAIFKIGEKYLVFDAEKSCYPKVWQDIFVDEHALLEDVLSGGLYGDSSMSRKHSSTLTLNAVRDEKKGKKVKTNVMKSIFPSSNMLKGRYQYLEKYPVLLPVAWVDRIWKYQAEIRKISKDQPMESIKIGNQRIEMLKEYGIIKEDDFFVRN